jgi:D-serine dehydratase
MEPMNRLIDALRREPIDWRSRCFPTADGVDGANIREARWNVLQGDLLLPALVLKESALAHNLAVMSRFCRDHGVEIAPHGKTTMSPSLFARQLEAGAWAMTVATVSQARVARNFGIGRILIANEVVEPSALRWIATELGEDDTFDCFCLVDSVAGVERMSAALAGCPSSRPLPVLLELGVPGGRAGCRTLESALKVAEAVDASQELELAGVEGFEGILSSDAVDRFLGFLGDVARAVEANGWFDHLREVLLTAGGSAFFDRVAEQLTAVELGRPSRVVLRSGCYLTHDSGAYDIASPLGSKSSGEQLRPALEAWGVVLSRPEPTLAVVGLGKRDVPYDAGLPVPVMLVRDGERRPLEPGCEIRQVNDQHAYLHLRPRTDMQVGDIVGCGISHPCTAFDKWSVIPVIDDDYFVIDTVRTFF